MADKTNAQLAAEATAAAKAADKAAREGTWSPNPPFSAPETAAEAAARVAAGRSNPVTASEQAKADAVAKATKALADANAKAAAAPSKANSDAVKAAEKSLADANKSNAGVPGPRPRQSNEWNGATWTLTRNTEGLASGIEITPIRKVSAEEAKRVADAAKFAGYHQSLANVRAKASAENRGKSASEVEEAVLLAVATAEVNWTGPKPPVDSKAEAEAKAAETKRVADAKAVAAQLEKNRVAAERAKLNEA